MSASNDSDSHRGGSKPKHSFGAGRRALFVYDVAGDRKRLAAALMLPAGRRTVQSEFAAVAYL